MIAIHTRLHTAITPKFKLRRDFCTVNLPRFRQPMFNRLEVIMLTNKQTNKQTNKKTQTNRFCWKHPTFFAMLRRWVINKTQHGCIPELCVTSGLRLSSSSSSTSSSSSLTHGSLSEIVITLQEPLNQTNSVLCAY